MKEIDINYILYKNIDDLIIIKNKYIEYILTKTLTPNDTRWWIIKIRLFENLRYNNMNL